MTVDQMIFRNDGFGWYGIDLETDEATNAYPTVEEARQEAAENLEEIARRSTLNKQG